MENADISTLFLKTLAIDILIYRIGEVDVHKPLCNYFPIQYENKTEKIFWAWLYHTIWFCFLKYMQIITFFMR